MIVEHQQGGLGQNTENFWKVYPNQAYNIEE